MDIDFKKYLPLLVRLLIAGLTIVGIYFVSTTLIFYILPFLLGWLVASAIEPTVDLMTNRFKMPRSLSAFISTLFFVLFTGLLISLVGGIIIVELTKLSIDLPEYSKKIYIQGLAIFEQAQNVYFTLPPDIAQQIMNGLYTLVQSLSNLLTLFLSSLLGFLSGIPSVLVFILVTIISTFFIARDKQMITRFIRAQIPSGMISKGKILKHDLLFALLGYIKAQLILMSITFIECAIGLTIIGIDYSVLVALVASIIDAFPILGTGSVFVPMIIWHLVTGKYKIAVSLAVLYGILIFVRQLLEPKVLGTQIGLYPLVTLMAMYIGLKLFGVIGLIIGPISMIVLMTLQKVDILPKWKEY
ncbi:MAG: sporulation integral rane protein YtvI [Anaerosolibacter sp.]|jgi:sporulation integral membrane protein YtvI|uniref:sporulation integral membrane protein YtvI n=1 Tax=Anaerosolibacter sp. TaxID=1872527 RepID=UPI002615E3C1|nr:sporulation integral membrane protein YtvI [Anaerosolibacter sp.]MDF2547789.1 sporulation integral rane protein YtvI [Anaerosolibacter sp.]